MKNWLFLALGGGVLWWLYQKGSASGQLKWNISGLDIKTRSVIVDLINPTNTNLNFDALVADVKLNGAPVGIMDYRKETTINAKGSTRIKIPIKLNTLGVLQFVANKLQKIKTIDFNGTLNAEGVSIPFNETFNLPSKA